ncbi:hypothetical protein CN692_10095 [Bacillus sp. AFS002410]|nr:hypothetical protein CN692_10095 [Bacillus sp. AFS002410]
MVLYYMLFILKKLIGTEGFLTPMGNAGRLRPHRRHADEAQESRPMESENPAVEINIIQHPLD